MFKGLHSRVEYQGSGLGLAICQKLALKMDGKIEVVESIIGEGTTFRLTINKKASVANIALDDKQLIHS